MYQTRAFCDLHFYYNKTRVQNMHLVTILKLIIAHLSCLHSATTLKRLQALINKLPWYKKCSITICLLFLHRNGRFFAPDSGF